MDTDGVRRSGRVRNAVKTFQSEQEQAALALPVRKIKVKVKPELGEYAPARDELSEESAAIKIQPINSKADAERSFDKKPSKKRSRPTEPDEVKGEDESDFEQERPKKKKRTKKSPTASGQLYGAPPAGTLIPFGTRWRKQPLIFAVTRGSGTAKNNDWMNAQAEERVRETLESIKQLAPGEKEERLAPFIAEPDEDYHGYLHRANTNKMFILSRLRGIEDCHANMEDCPFETLQIAGSKGNVYSVRVSHLPTCTCPSSAGLFKKGVEKRQCKHVIYVLHHVLKAPEHLKYQKAFLSSELKELFDAAPPLPAQAVKDDSKDGKRKDVEGDSPVCFTAFDEDESVSWCRSSCGNNIHTECLKEWAKAKTAVVTCPFCRTPWDFNEKKQEVTVNEVDMQLTSGQGGYVNVFDQLAYK